MRHPGLKARPGSGGVACVRGRRPRDPCGATLPHPAAPVSAPANAVQRRAAPRSGWHRDAPTGAAAHLGRHEIALGEAWPSVEACGWSGGAKKSFHYSHKYHIIDTQTDLVAKPSCFGRSRPSAPVCKRNDDEVMDGGRACQKRSLDTGHMPRPMLPHQRYSSCCLKRSPLSCQPCALRHLQYAMMVIIASTTMAGSNTKSR